MVPNIPAGIHSSSFNWKDRRWSPLQEQKNGSLLLIFETIFILPIYLTTPVGIISGFPSPAAANKKTHSSQKEEMGSSCSHRTTLQTIKMVLPKAA
jgi:hypothetical protein